jgi:hypothetical protein
MFIRPCRRKKNGKQHAYWALVESVRTDRGPRQRTIAYLGQLDKAGRLGVKRAAEGNERSDEQQLQLWEDDSPAPEWVEVDTANVRVENQLDFGGPWLALELIRKLKLDELLESVMPRGKEDREPDQGDGEAVADHVRRLPSGWAGIQPAIAHIQNNVVHRPVRQKIATWTRSPSRIAVV